MYKYRGKVMKRQEKKFTDTIKKTMEGNLNRTSKRLTIPLNFLSQGIISDTVKKDSSNDFDKEQVNVYKFLGNSQVTSSHTLRRSARLSKKNIIFNISPSHSSSSHCESEPSLKKPKYSKTPFVKNIEVSKNNSKSLFRQINQKYEEIERKNNNHSRNPVLEKVDPINSDFCSRLSVQIPVKVSNRVLDNCKFRLKEKLKIINSIISGKFDMSHYNKENIFPKVSSEDSQDTDFHLVPSSEWVYETPPRQKPIVPKVNECNIQPAVLYTNNNRRSLYEMNPNITIDLTCFSNKQNVPYDKRFMQHVATVDHGGKNVDDGIRFLENREESSFNFFRNFQLSQFEESNSGRNIFNFEKCLQNSK